MNLVITPNSLRDAINAKLDAAIAACPAAQKDREELYRQLLQYFNEHGELPDFSLAKKEENELLTSALNNFARVGG